MRPSNRYLLAGLFTLVLAACVSGPPVRWADPSSVAAPLDEHGEIASAPYRVDIPANWNGQLVMLKHGYEPVGMPRSRPPAPDPSTPVFLARGFAVAASSYSRQGWAVAEALKDNARLLRHFEERYGRPLKTYAVGISMGGHIALAAVEQEGHGYDGALSLCGVNLPAAEVFSDGLLTPLLALEYFFPTAMPLAPGGLADPASPPYLDPAAIEAVLSMDETRTQLMVRRLGIERPALAGALALNYLVLREMQQRAGGHPADNTEVVYSGFGDDAAFNRGVRRYPGEPGAIRYAQAHAALTGRTDVPVVLQSNHADPTVPAHYASRYFELAKAAGSGSKVTVMPAVGHGHCDFSTAQLDAAFQALVQQP